MNILNLVRKNILELKPYTSARQSHLNGILLDANENSFGSVIDDDGNQLNRYPDPYQNTLRNSLSKIINIPKENLFFGVGSDEIIDLLIRIFCIPGEDNIIVCEPTYGVYKVAADINDIKVKNAPLTDNFHLNIDNIFKQIDERTKIIFLCSPNNPTSNLLKNKDILKIADKVNSLIVVDEAYIDFSESEGMIKYPLHLPNIVVMRTFSKAWGLAGVRCGYSVANDVITNLLFSVKAPYNMNKLTVKAVIDSLNNLDQKEIYTRKIISERNRVYENLIRKKRILNVLKSDANFISFKVEEPRKIFLYLEKEGIIIRDRSNQYNFSGYLRVTIGTEKENDLFLQKLEEIL